VRSWHEAIERRADQIAAGSHVVLSTRTAAWSEGTVFPDDVLAALGRGLPPDAPRLLCYAGHDAGVVARVRPAGMVFVRNPSGISHAAQERVSLDDAAVAATALLRAAEELAS
jgi:N-carbamoyl-L-amino-acid hydrolase